MGHDCVLSTDRPILMLYCYIWSVSKNNLCCSYSLVFTNVWFGCLLATYEDEILRQVAVFKERNNKGKLTFRKELSSNEINGYKRRVAKHLNR